VREKGFSEPVAVRIAVVDPLPLFRQGVASVLQAAGHLVETPLDVLAWAQRNAAALVLITVSSDPDWELFGCLCARTGASQPVIALVDKDSTLLGARALQTGARSVVPRDVTAEALLRTVEATIEGQAVMPTAVAAALVSGVHEFAENRLSIDQLSWLRELANGMTVAQLADRTGYSERAMFRLLNALYRQIGARNRLQAIMRAQEAGWL
jgi:DNA-binding NarL/FixJ family response regulator